MSSYEDDCMMIDVGGSAPSYATILKDLIEALVVAKNSFSGDKAEGILDGLTNLLDTEVKFQLEFQADMIKLYKENKAKEAIKGVDNNVTPLKKK